MTLDKPCFNFPHLHMFRKIPKYCVTQREVILTYLIEVQNGTIPIEDNLALWIPLPTFGNFSLTAYT